MKTPASQRAAERRPILRFDLQSTCIDDKPNVYKDPKLVLKPQLDLAPRRPYTGSRPRMPVWRHFLMVHIKDKADELVKLDLAIFKPPSVGVDSMLRPSVSCSFSKCLLTFRYPNAAKNDSSTLSVTLQKPADLEVILRELGALGINVEHEPAHHDQSTVSGPAWSGLWAMPDKGVAQIYRPVSNPRQLNSSSPPLTTALGLHGGHARYPARPAQGTYGELLHRPPSQPIGQSAGLPTGQRPWSPAYVPSRPATTIGVPGILGEGIYKVSKIGSISSSQPRVRRTSTILGSQPPGLYTVSRHFDKTLSRGDILRTSKGRYLGPSFSSNPRPGESSSLARLTSLDSSQEESSHKPGPENPLALPPLRISSPLEGVPTSANHQAGLRRLRTIDDVARPELLSRADESDHHGFPASLAGSKGQSSASQPATIPGVAGPVDDFFVPSSSPTLFELPNRQEIDDKLLLRVSQIQHDGLCEASRLWDDFMGRASREMASAENPISVTEVLSKYEGEFVRRWEWVVAATAQKMRLARVRSFVF